MISFNPSRDQLQPYQRLRIVNGGLYVESSSVRANSCWLIRLFTRSQYSQTAILDYFRHLKPSPIILATYRELVIRAGTQNQKYHFSSHFVRWIKAKSEISLQTHWDRLNAHNLAKTEVNTPSDVNPPLNPELVAALKMLEEVKKKAQESAHATKLGCLIAFENQQAAVIRYLHSQKVNGVYQDISKVNAKLRQFSLYKDHSFTFNVAKQDPEYAIKTFPETYLYAYQLAIKKEIVTDFFAKTLQNPCMEGCLSSLIEWTDRHKDDQDEEDFTVIYDRQRDSWDTAIAAYHKVFISIEFYKAFKEIRGERYYKSNKQDQILEKCFTAGSEVKRLVAPNAWEAQRFAQKGTLALTKANFKAFVIEKMQSEPSQSIPFNEGTIALSEIEEKVDTYWDLVEV